jgi:membrane protein DedA with SNARE-associated domain|tara:strand:- start:5368 stop:5592 length:225 start_codon:yes stop_codon:yes gene_type:complete
MNKTEKVALRESIIVVLMGAVINFPLQTYLLWLTIDNWKWADPLKISIFIQIIITVVALLRVYAIRMRFQRGKF